MGLFRRKKEEKKQEKEKEKGKTESKAEVKPKSMKELYGGTGTGKKKTSEEKKQETKKETNAYRVLIKPLVTEKAASLSAENKYIFAIAPNTNKIEVARAIKDIYGVEPIKVNIIRVRGKQVRYGRILGRRKSWKKAVVTLHAGESIDVYEGV